MQTQPHKARREKNEGKFKRKKKSSLVPSKVVAVQKWCHFCSAHFVSALCSFRGKEDQTSLCFLFLNGSATSELNQ